MSGRCNATYGGMSIDDLLDNLESDVELVCDSNEYDLVKKSAADMRIEVIREEIVRRCAQSETARTSHRAPECLDQCQDTKDCAPLSGECAIAERRAVAFESTRAELERTVAQPGCTYPQCGCVRTCKPSAQSAAPVKADVTASFVTAIRNLVNGSEFDLTDSPKSLAGNVVRLVNEYDEAIKLSAPSSGGVAIEEVRRSLHDMPQVAITSAHRYLDACGDARIAIRYADDSEEDRPATELERLLSEPSAAPAEGVASIPPHCIRRLEWCMERLALGDQVNRHLLYDEIKAVVERLRTTSATGGAIESPEDVDRRTMLNETAVGEAIDAEPELPGPMPDEMWEAIRNDRDACMEALRITVRQTKSGIKDRLGISHADRTPRP